MQQQISKEQLIAQITRWKDAKLSNVQLQDWMVTHYDPPDVEIGKGENETVIEAMNIIMNEYELAKVDKFKIESAQAALDFFKLQRGYV